MNLKNVAIFKTGKHTDMKGREKEWTEKDLDATISKYKPAVHEAPVVVGHPEANAPAYGWIESLKRVGDTLYADMKDLSEGFVNLLKEGRFKKRSASFYPDSSLRHVGFLGAMPPAVKGLADISFGDADAASFEFEELQTTENITITGGNMDNEVLKKQLETKEKENHEFSEKNKSLAEENEAMKKRLAEMETAGRKTDHAQFCEKLVAAGKLSPANKADICDFMEILSSQEAYNFAEGGQASPLDKFKKMLENSPKIVEFSEIATGKKAGETPATGYEAPAGNVDPDRHELHVKILDYAEKKGVSYEIACKELTTPKI